MFASVASSLNDHISNAERRCRSFEEEARYMKHAARSGDIEAAAHWWWEEYCSTRDAVMSLIDGKVRHEYDRAKAVRTPNATVIHWQKGTLRTGESQDNLRALLSREGGKRNVAEYDSLNRRIEELQDTIKRIRTSLVLEVRSVRVSGFAEENQEMRVVHHASGGGRSDTELRLHPRCGYSLEECTCNKAWSCPDPVQQGSLCAAIWTATEEASVLGTGAHGDSPDGRDATGRSRPASRAQGVIKAKRKRVLDDDDIEEDHREGDETIVSPTASSPAHRNKKKSATDAAEGAGVCDHNEALSSSLDYIKRQMGANPVALEQKKEALEEEMRASRGTRRRYRSHGDEAAPSGGEDTDASSVRAGLVAAGAKTSSRAREESDGSATQDEQDSFSGMEAHEKAEWLEERGRFKDALRWHREDLLVARSRVLDGEDEDERELSHDVARALRNTGRCLGSLGVPTFEEAKKHLLEARSLVGPDGMFPCPAEEQDVMLELGNLWYNRYIFLVEKGIHLFGDEALDSALRCYREARELCIDLVAEASEEEMDRLVDDGCGRGQELDYLEGGASAFVMSCRYLLRAEFNVGMALVEKGEHVNAMRHLSAVEDNFCTLLRETTKADILDSGGSASAEGTDRQSGGIEAFLDKKAVLRTALEREGVLDLASLFAGSLDLKGECMTHTFFASPPLHSTGSAQPPIEPPAEPDRDHEFEGALAALAASVQCYIAIGEAEGALGPLTKLVRHLRTLGDTSRKGRQIVRANGLLDLVCTAMAMDHRRGTGEGDKAERRGQTEVGQIRADIDELHRSCSSGSGSDTVSRTRSVAERERNDGPEDTLTQWQQRVHEQTHQRSRSNSRDRHVWAPAEPAEHKVGPPTIARRRPRKATEMTTRGTGALSARARRPARRGRVRTRPATRYGEGITDSGGRGRPSERAGGDSHGSSLPAADPRDYSEKRSSFTALREAFFAAEIKARAADVDAAAQTAAANAEATGRQETRAATMYLTTCALLSVQPSARVVSRLATIKGQPNADVFVGETSERSPMMQGALDLEGLGLTDEDVQIILHTTFGDGAPASVPTAASTGRCRAVPSPDRISAVLLGGNPRIGARALAALRGGKGNAQSRGVLGSLVHLDLSRCGLTAADFAGVSSTAHGAQEYIGLGADGEGIGTATMCLRVLILRDNPLNRVGIKRPEAPPQIQSGLTALKNLIARAPFLDLLDLSGCSKLPSGTSSRLYSSQVSDSLASAISEGLQSRLSGVTASAGKGRGGTERAQVATLRLQSNRFRRFAWAGILRHLAVHPPREFDLVFAGVGGDDALADGKETTFATRMQFAAAPLADLLASMLLPPDSPGIEVLNLVGSAGLLSLRRRPSTGADVEASSIPVVSRPLDSYLVLLQDAMMSPLCTVTDLFLSGVREPSPAGAMPTSDEASATAVGRALGPEHVRTLCEASSACVTLRCLDLCGSDLSGPLGAAASAAAIACLVRYDDEDQCDYQHSEPSDRVGSARPRSNLRLRRVSLRACRLGAAGLSAVMGAILDAFSCGREDGRALVANQQRPGPTASSEAFREAADGQGGGSCMGRRHHPLPMFPRRLDLSENMDGQRAHRGDTGARREGVIDAQEASSLEELSAVIRTLAAEGFAAMNAGSSTSDTAQTHVSLVGNGLDIAEFEEDTDGNLRGPTAPTLTSCSLRLLV